MRSDGSRGTRRVAERAVAACGIAAVIVVTPFAATGGQVRARPGVPELAEAGRILFVRGARGRACIGEIWTMSPSGSQQRRLIVRRGGVCSPRWSRDGTHIAFAWRDRGIFIADADGQEIRRVTRGRDTEPDWSPGDDRIVFESTIGGSLRSEVYLADADGSNRQILAGGPWEDAEPRWSPDGRVVLFVSDRERWPTCPTCRSLCLIRPDRLRFRRITGKGIDATTPAWSRDGSRIAWRRKVGRELPTLTVMNARTHAIRALTVHGSQPTWSPDGATIVFVRRGRLYRIGANGGRVRRLTLGPSDASPDWRPR